MEFIVGADDAQKRLDQFLAQKANKSRSFIARAIKEDQITVNNKKEKGAYKVQQNDKVIFNHVEQLEAKKTAAPLKEMADILFENDFVLVLNKKPGVIMHHGSFTDNQLVLEDAIHNEYPSIKVERAGIVHRLDKDTSGVVLIAKNTDALQYVQNQFKSRTAQKTYLALVDGICEAGKKLHLEHNITRSKKNPTKFIVAQPNSTNTKRAILDAMPLQNGKLDGESTTLMALFPRTGRTHQIRVQLLHIGHHILGDKVYHSKVSKLIAPRQMLHARELAINIPTIEIDNELQGEKHTFQAPIPDDMSELIQKAGIDLQKSLTYIHENYN